MTTTLAVRSADLAEALAVVLGAAGAWAEWAEENGGGVDVEAIDEAVAVVRAAVRGEEEKPVVVCVRHPGFANEFIVTGRSVPEPTILDVDLGTMALDDPGEFEEWASSQFAWVEELPVGHPAREVVLRVVNGQREMYHEDRWADLNALRTALGAG